jgi:2-oxoglutarate dehydrogenase E2 component (dihydrolipoamide succinyltransferase)
MSKKVNVLLPKLGESILSATIVKWCKKIGDPVVRDEPLLEVSTDKVNSEIPSPAAGVLIEIHAQEGEELEVGALLAVLGGENVGLVEEDKSRVPPEKTTTPNQGMQEFYSPALLRLAREKGVSLEELGSIAGSGGGGRLTRRDLEVYLDHKTPTRKPCSLAAHTAHEVERVQMSGMRKAIADNMVRSFYEAPHATLVTEVDVTAVMKFIQKHKQDFLEKNGYKLTITSFVAHAIAKALQEFPLINSSLDGDTILLKRFVNLGIATSVEQGLVVPVVRGCQRLSVTALAKAIHALSIKARQGKLGVDDISDGTISLTNFGMTGVQIGVPIIRHPEVAIIGIGAIHKKVVPLEEDLLAVRQMVYVSLTFDHRVLDGMYGCGFLSALQKHLESNLKID